MRHLRLGSPPHAEGGVLVILLGLLLWSGCLDDASRGNPVDPRSDNFDASGRLEGRVTSIYAPFQPLPGATVEISGPLGTFVARTDARGTYTFDALPTGEAAQASYDATVRLDGYATATDTLTVPIGGRQTRTFRLGGVPVVTDVQLETVRLSRWWPPPQDLFTLRVVATLTDPDGPADLDRVWLELPEFETALDLAPGAVPGRFERALSPADLPTESVQALQGRQLQLRARDRAGIEAVSPPLSLVRVIDVTPVATSPQGGETLATAQPQLTWAPVRLPYAFTYRLAVTRLDSGIETTVWTAQEVPSTETSIQVSVPLTSGVTYNWTLSVVDAFGNESRSKPAGFILSR